MDIEAFAATHAAAPLTRFTYTAPPLGPHDILVDITHCGLCHSDLHLIDNSWNRTTYPLVPGHEIVGAIAQRGPDVTLPLGARVGASWLYSSCLNCETCRSGNNQLCPKKRTMCIGHHGGFARQTTLDSRFVFQIPDALDSAVAAPLLCAGATTYAPLRRQRPGGHVAVIGIGGLGHLALQFARAMGFEVTAISSTPNKEADARALGAHHFAMVDSDLIMRFDAILSTVHVNLDWNRIMSFLKPMGTLCFLGRPAAPLQLDVAGVLSTQRSLTGSSTASLAVMNEMLAFAAQFKIAPQIEHMKMSQINEAIVRLRAGKVRYRIVLSA